MDTFKVKGAMSGRLIKPPPMVNDELLIALRSLVARIDDLEAAWPTINRLGLERLDGLVGFLFATVPLARAALAKLDEQGERHGQI